MTSSCNQSLTELGKIYLYSRGGLHTLFLGFHEGSIYHLLTSLCRSLQGLGDMALFSLDHFSICEAGLSRAQSTRQ